MNAATEAQAFGLAVALVITIFLSFAISLSGKEIHAARTAGSIAGSKATCPSDMKNNTPGLPLDPCLALCLVGQFALLRLNIAELD